MSGVIDMQMGMQNIVDLMRLNTVACKLSRQALLRRFDSGSGIANSLQDVGLRNPVSITTRVSPDVSNHP